ncbi:MMPL family transporter [Nocardia salmonicida]
MAKLLYRLGKFAYRRKKVVLAVWLALLVLTGLGAATLSGETTNSFSIPGTSAQQALDLQNDRFGDGSDPLTDASAVFVFSAPEGQTLNDGEFIPAINQTLTEIRKLDAIDQSARVAPETATPQSRPLLDPVTADGALRQQLASQGGDPATIADNAAALSPLSPDSRTGTVTVPLTGDVTSVTTEVRDQLYGAADPARAAGLTVEVGGNAMQETTPPGGTAELIGLGVAAVVLIIMFGSLVAATLPLLTAVVGVALTSLIITTSTGFLDLSEFTPVLAIMIGLAVAIDYSLFITALFRDELTRTDDRAEAAGRAVGTAGSSVVFAGLTVIIALVALRVVNIPFLTAMGAAAALGVLIAVLASLTMLPAMPGLLGKRAFGGVVRSVPSAADKQQMTAGRRWVERVVAHPVRHLAAGVAILAVAAIPLTRLELALPSVATDDPSSHARQAYESIGDSFGPGRNGPLLIIADAENIPEPERAGAFTELVAATSRTSGVENAQIVAMTADSDTAQILVTPTSGPSSAETRDLVGQLRSMESDTWQVDPDLAFGVTGQTAMELDISDQLGDALTPYLLVVIGLAFLLLMIVFRSVLVPLTATLGFLLSVLATLGATVFVFQEGGFGLVSNPQPLVSFMPIFLIGIVFGLAMDYQVFLVSRMREARTRGQSPVAAIVNGFSSSARVVTAAAMIMIAVFAAFILEDNALIKSIGFALAIAVAFDAFIVRMTIIPALLALLGRHAWWLPKWLDSVLPKADIEGDQLEAEIEKAAATDRPHLVDAAKATRTE